MSDHVTSRWRHAASVSLATVDGLAGLSIGNLAAAKLSAIDERPGFGEQRAPFAGFGQRERGPFAKGAAIGRDGLGLAGGDQLVHPWGEELDDEVPGVIMIEVRSAQAGRGVSGRSGEPRAGLVGASAGREGLFVAEHSQQRRR